MCDNLLVSCSLSDANKMNCV